MPLDGGSRSLRRALVSIGAAVALAGCARVESARPTETTMVASPMPAATAAALPIVATPVSTSSTAAATSDVVPKAVVPAPASPASAGVAVPSAAPSVMVAAQILSVVTSPSVVHAGEAVNWDVRTTSDIVAVTAHVASYTIPLHRTATGRFALSFAIPNNVPAIFHGTYNLEVTGESTTGVTAKRTVSMTFQ